jgi:tetratricopeptide (TPR) repeat protein
MGTRFLRFAFFFFALSGLVLAQGRAGGGKPPLGSPGSSGSVNLPSIGPAAGSAIFVSGKVVLDDGTDLTEPAVILTICSGQRHSQTYSDMHGSFSFQFGDPTQGAAASISDASNSSMPGQARAPRDLGSCQLQAELAGFSSQSVELGGRSDFASAIDVGRVPLHRLEHVEGTSISVTSALAPKAAQKAFEKGLEQEKKSKWGEAQKSFEKAVQIYPRYATAWYQLGRLQLRNASHPEDAQAAKHSFEQSVAADPKYVNPYDGLDQLAMQARDWPNVVAVTGKLLSLNPVNFPHAYFDSAVANYYLKNFDQAEASALQGIRVDDAHQIPKLQYLLGMILAQKQSYQEASEHIQQYLSMTTDPAEIALAKKSLAEIKKVSASTQPPVVDLDK